MGGDRGLEVLFIRVHLWGLGVCAGKQTKQGQVSSYPLSKRQTSNNQM